MTSFLVWFWPSARRDSTWARVGGGRGAEWLRPGRADVGLTVVAVVQLVLLLASIHRFGWVIRRHPRSIFVEEVVLLRSVLRRARGSLSDVQIFLFQPYNSCDERGIGRLRRT